YLDKLPSFQLHFVGRSMTTWWREYTLKIIGVECKIKETFPNGMFENGWIEAKSTNCNHENDKFISEVQGSNSDKKVWSIDKFN
ncbi:3095_t:CDS:1, partial [Racocetra persica]